MSYFSSPKTGASTTSTRKSFFDSGGDTGLDAAKIDTQITNAEKRIADAGYVKADADRRNWFEKATNLPQGQNWLFDTLELIGRGGNAIKNVVDKTIIEGNENLGEAAYNGLSGREKVHGSNIAEKLGVENKVGKFLLGTALDIGLDPTTYIPGGVIAKGLKGTAGLAAKPIKAGYNALESASPAVKAFRESQLAPAAESFKDGLGYMFKRDYKIDETLNGGKSMFLRNLDQQTENSRQFMQEDTLGNLGKTARDAGGIEAGTDVGRILEAPLRQFEDVKGYEFPDGVTRTMDKKDLFAAVDNSRKAIKDVGKDIRSTNREYSGAIGDFAKGIDQTDSEIRKLYMGLERQAGKQVGNATRTNIREAGREMARIDSQLANFGKTEAALLRHTKQQIRATHEMNFDLVRKVRQTAPNGIKGVERAALPASLHSFVRPGGKGIDEVANELGYQHANDLVQDLSWLKSMPRRLDEVTVERLSRQQLERTGALKQLAMTQQELASTRETLKNSMKEIRKGAPAVNAAKATEKAFADLSQNGRYIELNNQRNTLKSQLDTLKGESKQAKSQRIEQIKTLEKEIGALREPARNPVMIQKELPRPERDLSNNPKIQQAAQKMMQSNTTIRQFAKDNGIEIKELEGYMTHIWSQEERNLRKRGKAINVDQGRFGTGNPNKSILKSRENMGSAEDVNERVGRKFFEPNAFYASAIGQKRLIDYVHAVNFRRQVLSNRDFAVPFKKGMDVPKGTEVIDTNNYKFLKDSGDPLDGMNLADEVGGQYLVTRQAKQLLDRYQRLNTDEGTKAFLKFFDTIQSFWKRGALFSLGYHVRNQAGAMFNNYVGGMNPVDLAKYTQSGFREVARAVGGKESKLFTEYRQQGLSSTSLSQVEFARFGEEPEKAIEKTVKNLSKDTKGQVTQRLNPLNAFETSREVGNFFDQANRFGLYKWARDKG